MQTQFRNVPSIDGKSYLPLFRLAASWYGEKLMGKRLANNIHVKIEFVEGLEDEGTGGDCIWEDDNIRPREFTIQIDKSNDLPYMLTTLAHEMVHVKQFAKGELRDIMRAHSLCKWQGAEYNTEKLEYWDYPWEIEAHGREKGLYLRFCVYAGLTEATSDEKQTGA